MVMETTISPTGGASQADITTTASSLSCSVEDTVYPNGAVVESSSPCQENCTCLNGDVQCRQKACPSPPPGFLRCVAIDVLAECCPQYECRKFN